MSYLNFFRVATDKKTPEFEVKSGGMTLGVIKWYAQWRRLCFFPYAGTLFDGTCLAEINQKVNDEDAAYKAARKKGGK